MKVWSDDGRLTVQAESVQDMAKLIAIAGVGKIVEPKQKKDLIDIEVKVHGNKGKKHKRNAFKKECNVCGKFLKGLRGLGRHKAAMHGIRSERFTKKEDILREQGALSATPIEQLVQEVNGAEIIG